MRILIVYAHPEPDSLTGALKDVAVEHLRGAGQEVVVSDLYAMGWKAQADTADFGESGTGTFMQASGEAYSNGTLAADINSEQDKLRWTDAVLLHFPLWRYSMPAILEDWVDRVFTNGFAYGSGSTALPRYGAGALSGRRAMLVVSIGGREPAYSERGINGHIDDLLFPIHHGILYYPGMDVLPPFLVHGTIRVDSERFSAIADDLRARLSRIDAIEPIPYRTQAGGDYDRSLRLRDGLGCEATGFGLHRAG
ncbi:NAD(P)H-dependent oxidoreductase [Nocardia sp. AB354]|uniref:NAD(P)H-dependent oxidoreductase n=1 Tax=Nocardia sp. AB354 TaxID=3413283 RepID=UPI003C1FB5BC